MAQEVVETASDRLLSWLIASTATSGVPLTVEDESTLLELARRLRER